MTGLALRSTIAAALAAALLPTAAVAASPHATQMEQGVPPAAQSNGNGTSNGSGNGNGGPKPPPLAAAGAGIQKVQGVVQVVSVSTGVVVVRQLDGKSVSVPYDRKTHVFVDGKLSRIADVKAGYVLSASWKAGRPATTLRFVRSG